MTSFSMKQLTKLDKDFLLLPHLPGFQRSSSASKTSAWSRGSLERASLASCDLLDSVSSPTALSASTQALLAEAVCRLSHFVLP